MSPSLSLATQGGRIGARTLEGHSKGLAGPGWGPPEVTTVLQQAFNNVTLIHHRGLGLEYMYRFRGTHKHGDTDIVPLSVAIGDACEPSRSF